jgi:hypothetical protein
VRAGGEFRHRQGADCQFSGEPPGVEVIEINHD